MAYVTCIDSIRYKYRRVTIQVAFFMRFIASFRSVLQVLQLLRVPNRKG